MCFHSFLIPAQKRERDLGDWNSSGRSVCLVIYFIIHLFFSLSLSRLLCAAAAATISMFLLLTECERAHESGEEEEERRRRKISKRDVSGTSPGQRERESARAHTHARRASLKMTRSLRVAMTPRMSDEGISPFRTLFKKKHVLYFYFFPIFRR
jgi:hypothetical protein